MARIVNAREKSHNRPLWRTAWRRIVRRPLQYVLLVFGVALGVAMMVSVDLANGSASRAFELSTDAVAGRTTHRIVGGPRGLDERVYSRLRAEHGYEPAAPVVEGYLLVEELGNRPMRLVGVDPFAEPPFRTYFGTGKSETPIEGYIAFLSEPNTVLISEDVATQNELKLGSTLTLNKSGYRVPARLVGLLAPSDGVSQRALEGLIFADVSTAQEILGMIGRLSHIDLITQSEEDLALISKSLPNEARLETARARSNALRQMASAFELNLTALSLLALVVGMFLIYNTVTFSIVQRRKLFGILRSLGVTGGQLLLLILTEAAALGFVGALLGLAVGVLLGRGMVSLVSQTINDFYFVVNVRTVTIPPETLVKGLLVGVVAAVAASAIPAWEVMRTTPESSLRRSVVESKARRLVNWLVLIFVIGAVMGSFLLWLEGVSLIITFAGLFTVLIAFAFLTPALTARLMTLLPSLTGRLFGVIGHIAPRDISRSLSRTSVAIGALMIAVSVIVGVSIMIGSFRQTVSNWLANTLQADVYLSPPSLTANRVAGQIDPDVVNIAQTWPGVERAVTAWNSEIQSPSWRRPVEIVAVDGDISEGNRSYAWVAGNLDDLWDRLGDGQGVLVSEPLIIRENLSIPPPPITLMTDKGPHDFPVLAVIYDYSSDQGAILIDRDYYDQLWGEPGFTSVGLFIDPERSMDDVVAELQKKFSGREDVIVQSNLAVRGNALDIFDRTFAITAALQLLAVIVAFIGVLSALMSLQLERTRELGVLRATGMTVRQLWQLMLLETGIMGATAGILAMPVGWVLAWILIYVINRRSFGWTLQMDLEPAYFLQAFLVAVVAALLAGVYPAFRAGKMIIATAIREE